ncbi:uncharacterized protein [Henckelia pumila]|uniref:uncharacterized protein isoform X2 n=1 Tax=Henckelia pumila TaxID=405737 RepID=UPI003C6DEC18
MDKLDKPEELSEPPSGYGLARDVWTSFVITRMSDDFNQLSDIQKERRKMNIYPHRLARKGYARYAEEIVNDLCYDDGINRAIIWKKGRVNKEGEFEGHELKKAVDKIDEYIHQKIEGTLEIKGAKKDILTKALNTGEHGGRVRAVGGHITPTLYFNVGRCLKTDIVDRELMIEQGKELVEARKLIAKQDTHIEEQDTRLEKQDSRIKKLEAII